MTVGRWILGMALALGVGGRALAQSGTVSVAYAGSMGAVMDDGLGPAFTKQTGAAFHGTGQGAYGLARLIAAKKLPADVFVTITSGPVELLQKSGQVGQAVPVASTQMVIAYQPGSRFARAIAGGKSWWQALEEPGMRFGRTDPTTDPQGQAIILTMQLAALYYHQPGLETKILGPIVNPAQIFTEPSILSRLQQGQLDASSGYLAAVKSLHLPYVTLPDEINLSNPAMASAWYDKAGFELPASGGAPAKAVKVQPLVYYAAAIKGAPDEALGEKFVAFLQSAQGAALLTQFGYGPVKGGPV